jgi:indole-3-glycerol phosphate synthase
MIESHLSSFVSKRLDALKTIDQQRWPEESLRDMPFFAASRPSLKQTLLEPRLSILAEVKKASPTMGELSPKPAKVMCEAYLNSGADAISVLVDQPNFKGHPEDLLNCAEAYPSTPILFKDFVATEYQVLCAKAIGASAVLLMTQLLDSSELLDLFHLSHEIGLEAFVETHDAQELDWAIAQNPDIIGINSRDFKTPGLPIDLSTAGKLSSALSHPWPRGCALVAQSGISSAEDLARVLEPCPQGLPHAVQVGSSLSQSGTLPHWLTGKARQGD